MGLEYFIIALIGFMILAALIAAEAKDLLSSVIALGAAGFALSVLDLLLGAPDLALTQVVVEVIALVLLIRLIVTRKDTSQTASRDALRTGLVMIAGSIILVVAFFAFGGAGQDGAVPQFGQPLFSKAQANDVNRPVSVDYLAKTAEETGAANVVMGILLDIRGYDTLGEATVIFVSILGVYVILRKRGRISAEAEGAQGKERQS